MSKFYGRCTEVHSDSVVLRNTLGSHRVRYDTARSEPLQIGDIVEVEDERARVLTRSRTNRLRWMNRILNDRRRRAIGIRAQTEAGIRAFFNQRGFLETRTPLLVPCPGMEPHIRPIETRPVDPGDPRRAFLPTSPEFAMKRLLVGGLEKIFQICPAFRDEPESVTHHPEFTMLEWYRAYAGYEEIMTDTEELLQELAMRIHGKPSASFQGTEISFRTPWPRLEIRDLFEEYADIDLIKCSTSEALSQECDRLGLKNDLNREDWDDLYFKIWLNVIEPRLPSDRAVLVTRYPASQAALSVIDTDPDGSRWARRFEAYAGGLELGNAFEELTDPLEQRKRFEKDMELREAVYGREFPANPMDEGFLEALAEGMPPSGGIAMGVDRMVMLLADEPEISYTQWLPSALK